MNRYEKTFLSVHTAQKVRGVGKACHGLSSLQKQYHGPSRNETAKASRQQCEKMVVFCFFSAAPRTAPCPVP